MLAAANWILWLVFYSFLGWAYESALLTVVLRQWTNRGFLHGPLCPIYGIAAILAIALFYGRKKNVFFLFFVGMIMATGLEYIASVVLEFFFNTRWWDYSARPFNIQGRVCLLGAAIFGTMVVLLIRVMHPQVEKFAARIPDKIKIALAAIFVVAIAMDFVVTAARML